VAAAAPVIERPRARLLALRAIFPSRP
jgi:hypothetical protein